MSALAKDSGLDVKLFKTSLEQKRDFYAEVPVQISLGGTYHQLASFFDAVGHLTRIVNISNVSIGSPRI